MPDDILATNYDLHNRLLDIARKAKEQVLEHSIPNSQVIPVDPVIPDPPNPYLGK